MPEWVRCRDEHGNEFDLSPDDRRVRDKVVKVIDGYPENSGSTAVARAPKAYVDKAGARASKTSTSKTAGGSSTGRDVGQPEKE